MEINTRETMAPEISHVDITSLIGPDVSCFGVVAVVRDQHYKYRVNPIIGQNKDQILALVFPHIGNEPFYCSIFAKLGDKKPDLINSMRVDRERERERERNSRWSDIPHYMVLQNLIIHSHLINKAFPGNVLIKFALRHSESLREVKEPRQEMCELILRGR